MDQLHAGVVLLGVACVVVAGLLLYFVGAGLSFYGVSAQVLVSLAIAAIAIAMIVVFLLYKAFLAGRAKVKTGREALIGARGVAVGDLKPSGTVRVNSEFWQATVKDGEIGSGEEVEVVGLEGLFLIVMRVKEKA